jgi:hypothetical protein
VADAFAGDAFFALCLSTNRTFTVPLPPSSRPPVSADPLVIPEPALLVGAAVRDTTLPAVLQTVLARSHAVCTTSEVAGVTLVSVTVPQAEGFPLHPTYALYRGMLLFGSTPEAVAAAISAAGRKDGLRATAPFQKAFAGLPAANNGIAFLDPRLTETTARVQQHLLQATGAGAGGFFGNALFAPRGASHLFVVVNEPGGVAIHGATSDSALQTLRGFTLAPFTAAMGAAVAIPSFVRARATAANNSCINNLRMLDSAKEQWALEMTKKDGDPVVEAGVLQYIKGARMPVCPQGGRYTLGPIGKPPACSHPGHALP